MNPQRRGGWENEPWQVLVFAVLLFAPAVLLLSTGGHAVMSAPTTVRGGYTGPELVVSSGVIHAFGFFLLASSAVVLRFYFRLRNELRGGRNSAARRRRD